MSKVLKRSRSDGPYGVEAGRDFRRMTAGQSPCARIKQAAIGAAKPIGGIGPAVECRRISVRRPIRSSASLTTDPPVVYVLKIPPLYGLKRWNFCGVKVRAVVDPSLKGAWRRYRTRGAIERMAFNDYYAGAVKAVCLEIENPPPAESEDLRSSSPRFALRGKCGDAGGVSRISPHSIPPQIDAPGIPAKFVKAHRFRRAVDPYMTVKGFRVSQSFRCLPAQTTVH